MRIKVTGYLETDDLDPEEVDETHETGLSEEGYLRYSSGAYPLRLDDLEFEVEER